MRICRLFAAALLLGVSFTAFRADAECLSYSERVDFTGTLEEAEFPAPTNYDKHKTQAFWFIKLPQPVCIDADPHKSDINTAQDNIDIFELEVGQNHYDKYHALVDQPIHITGTLFGAIGLHHHSPVVIDNIEFVQE